MYIGGKSSVQDRRFSILLTLLCFTISADYALFAVELLTDVTAYLVSWQKQYTAASPLCVHIKMPKHVSVVSVSACTSVMSAKCACLGARSRNGRPLSSYTSSMMRDCLLIETLLIKLALVLWLGFLRPGTFENTGRVYVHLKPKFNFGTMLLLCVCFHPSALIPVTTSAAYHHLTSSWH